MKKILFILLCTVSCTVAVQAQSWKDFLNSKNVGKIASVAGIDIPFEIEGEWSYVGTAVELETDNMLKKAAAEMAAVAVEQKINEQQAKYGIKPGMLKFTFKNDGNATISALNQSLPVKYNLSKDKKSMNIKVANIINMDATIKHTIDNSLSILFEGDKVIELIKYLNTQVDYATIKTISQVLENYDGLKVGIELEKKR